MDSIEEQVGRESDSLDFANAALATGVTRRRQRTEKGKAFIAHVRWTDCQTLFRRIQRQMKEIDSLATDEENVDVVERNLTSFRFSVEELKSGFAALLNDLESEEDLDVANDWYINQSGKINDFLDKLYSGFQPRKRQSNIAWKQDLKLARYIHIASFKGII